MEGGDSEVEVVGEVTDLDGPVRWVGLQSHAPQDGSVRATELVREGCLVGWDEFVAGGEDGDARLAR